MFNIDTRSRDPIHMQLQKQIVKYVSLGILSPDQQLPSVRAMAQELSINPNTVQKAYHTLEMNKVIYTVAGRGAFISSEDSSLEQVKSYAESDFEQSVLTAKDTGLSKEDLVRMIDEIFDEGKDNG